MANENIQSRNLLTGKVAVLTGAASGIGRATALRFAAEGAKLALADVQVEALEEIRALVEKSGVEVVAQVTDVSKEDQVKTLIDLALSKFGQIDIVGNIAGISAGVSLLTDQTEEEWIRVWEINMLGTVWTTKHVAAHMQERGKGSIVNISSVGGVRSGAGGNAYSASKAAVINFTKTSACDLGKYNVRVNAICPGLVETGMTKPIFDLARERGKEYKLGSRCELRRCGTTDEIASAILFLASDEASYITGQSLAVDGGNTASLNLPGMKV